MIYSILYKIINNCIITISFTSWGFIQITDYPILSERIIVAQSCDRLDEFSITNYHRPKCYHTYEDVKAMTVVESGMPLGRAAELFVYQNQVFMNGHLGKSNMVLGLDHLHI